MSGKRNLRDRIYLSTIGEDCASLCGRFGLGMEIAEFCTAYRMDREFSRADQVVRGLMIHARRFTFHVAYNELCPAAIDPWVLDVTKRRYEMAVKLAASYGIRKLIIHSGYVPRVYFHSWFTERSVEFWRSFLETFPADMEICLENVMEEDPYMPAEIARQVNDPRFGLCLDVGHARVCRENTDDLQWVETMLPWLKHLHIHNNHGVNDEHLPLGEGVIPMEQILDLAGEQTEATFTIENMQAENSVTWLLEKGYIQ